MFAAVMELGEVLPLLNEIEFHQNIAAYSR